MKIYGKSQLYQTGEKGRKTKRTLKFILSTIFLFCFMLIFPVFVFGQTDWSSPINLPIPNSDGGQTACVVFDVDNDGVDDIVVGDRSTSPGAVWYKYSGSNWDKYVIDNTDFNPEAGGCYWDIDDDGDLDLVFGQDGSGNDVWWWENPYPNYNGTWTRRTIKNTGGNAHHHQIFGDFDCDGKVEFVTWVSGRYLWLYEIPANPKTSDTWNYTQIWTASAKSEGADAIDINGDGKLDFVGGARWFEHTSGTNFNVHVIDSDGGMKEAMHQAGQLVKGGWPEVVISPSDHDGNAKWYEWNGNGWVAHTLQYVVHGHTLDLADFDKDGNLDIMIGEMGSPGAGSDADIWIWYGDGRGNFTQETVLHGQGTHEGKVGDLDGDGDVDIVVKPYAHNTPKVQVIKNQLSSIDINNYTRKLVDNLPARAVFVESGDLNGDGMKDIIAGGYWWENPGNITGSWTRHTIGGILNNMTIVSDFDFDGDLDILGTEGTGSSSNHNFVWARNNGSGSFTILSNINYTGGGDFLQGRAFIRYNCNYHVALSWHAGESSTLALTIPPDPSSTDWTTTTFINTSENEDLSVGDIDRDGDLDLLTGTKWLQNNHASWSSYTIGTVASGEPDRCNLADINGDGRLDAVVSLENGTDVYWFMAPADPTGNWTRYLIGTATGEGFSMDAADFDKDGDPDVVLGEHRGSTNNRVIIFENDGTNSSWPTHIVDNQSNNTIDHHDGTQAVDLDGDGDLDIISIGWYNPKLWVFENKAAGITMRNDPPVVDAGSDQTTCLLWTSVLDATITDDGKPWVDPGDSNSGPLGLTVEWSKLSGPGQIHFMDPCSEDTTVTFTDWGLYKLKLSANDGQLSSSDTTTITVTIPGDLDIDWHVDLNDLSLWAARWLSHECDWDDNWCAMTDLDQKGTVNLFDFAYFSQNWLVISPDPLQEGLVAYWRFDEGSGTIAQDISGYDRHGIVEGATWVTIAAPLDGVALDFEYEHSTDRVEVSPFDVTGEGITIAAWINAESFSQGDARIVSKATGSGPDEHWWMLSTIWDVQGGIGLRFRLKTNGSTTTLIAHSGVLNTEEWTQVAATWDGSSMRLYKNGEVVGNTPKGGTLTSGPLVKIAIGNQSADAQGGLRPFDGVIDEVRIYDRALKQEEIQALVHLF